MAIRKGERVVRPCLRGARENNELTIEEVTLAGSVSAHHYIVTLVKGLDDRLLAVALEALDNYLKAEKPYVNKLSFQGISLIIRFAVKITHLFYMHCCAMQHSTTILILNSR